MLQHIFFDIFHIYNFRSIPQMEVEPRVAILQDLRLQSFDAIRFASYRTASKLRYIQKSTNRKHCCMHIFAIKKYNYFN